MRPLHGIALLAVAALAVAAGFGFSTGKGDGAPSPAPAAAPPEAREAPKPPEPPAAAPVPSGLAPAVAGDPALKLPDGSSLPLLNGVREPLALEWHGPRPYSPVTGKVYDPQTKTEWYVHEDGSYSTTIVRRDEARNIDVGLALNYQRREGQPAETRFRGQ